MYYKDQQNNLHALDSIEFEHLLPAGSIRITDDEAAETIEAQKPVAIPPDYSTLRSQAYRDESDPLFFKEQRGEVPIGTWLSKVNEIKARW